MILAIILTRLMLGKDSNGTKPESKVSFEVAGPLQPALEIVQGTEKVSGTFDERGDPFMWQVTTTVVRG